MVAEQNLFIVLKNMFDELHQQGLNSDIIDETYINNHLMTKDYPDPELLIRTSGERISNFLIWQVSYSEFIFNQNYGLTLTKMN